MRPLLLVLATSALAGCSTLGGGDALRYPVPPVTVETRVPSAFAAIEVTDVTLPAYAEGEEIALGLPQGGISLRTGLLWADLPARGMTLDLTRALGQITGAEVAATPWPFDRSPDARVEVRIEEFLARETGSFHLAGQYFVGAFDGSERARARSFAIAAPFDPAGGAPAIAAARAAATAELAETIARDGLR
jgi:uncharacterized lipoprotein YmbA